MTDYYEPWHPKIGDRVRVRLSPECRHPRGYHGDEVILHFRQENGRIGTVCDWPDDWLAPFGGHTVCVDFDRPFSPFPGTLIDGTVFAPAELELLGTEEP